MKLEEEELNFIKESTAQLIDKYGLDSVINMETGEVTQKTE